MVMMDGSGSTETNRTAGGGLAEIGTMLRRRREEVGQDLAAISPVTHIKPVFLKAIEEGRRKDLPGTAYMAVVRSPYPHARIASVNLDAARAAEGVVAAFSGADLLHGPLAMIEPQVPVLTVIAGGIGGDAMGQVLPRLAEQGADVFCVGTPDAVAQADVGVALPAGAPEELSPLLEILPFQQLAQHLAIARGGNPDAPRGLRKVTETL